MTAKPFLPRDKPKSWIVMLLAILIDLIVVAPLMFLASLLEWQLTYMLAWGAFIALWAVGVFCGVIFLASLIGGKHKALGTHAWGEQIW